MNTKTFLALALACTMFAACDDKMDTPNGHIPSQYLPMAQQFVGLYVGQVNREANAVNVSIDGDKIVLAPANDFIDPVCKSKIGDMLSFTYNNADGVVKITAAQFAFDPNLCSDTVLADHITLYFNDTYSFDIMYLDHYDRHFVCDAGSGQHQPQLCRWERTPYYSTGKFSK